MHYSFKSATSKSWITLIIHNSEHLLKSTAEGYGCKIH